MCCRQCMNVTNTIKLSTALICFFFQKICSSYASQDSNRMTLIYFVIRYVTIATNEIQCQQNFNQFHLFNGFHLFFFFFSYQKLFGPHRKIRRKNKKKCHFIHIFITNSSRFSRSRYLSFCFSILFQLLKIFFPKKH